MILNQIRKSSLLWRRFTPLEEFLLGILQRELPEKPRRINQRRIDLINRVSRCLKWTEIMFYQMRDGKPVRDEEAMFPCRSHEEIILAEIKFSPARISKVYKSEIYGVSGHMFSIVTRPSPKPISFCREYTLKSVKLVDDPMVEFPPTLLERLRKRLPPDYDDLAGQSVSRWRVFDPSDIYQVPLENANYILLAESEDGSAEYLGVRVSGKSNEVYYLPHEGRPEKVATNLRKAIERKS